MRDLGVEKPVSQSQLNSASRKVFLTAEDIERRIRSAGAGVIELAANERLTPMADDLLAERNISVRRAVTAADAPEFSPTIKSDHDQAVERLSNIARPPADRAVTGPVGLVLRDPTETVVAVLQALRHDGPMFADYTKTDCWLRNTEALAADLRNGAVAAGVLMLPYAADGMIVAGKTKGLRPVQATRVESVASAVRRFDANVLVLEHRNSTFHEMRAMVRTFTAARVGRADGDIVATIQKLERL